VQLTVTLQVLVLGGLVCLWLLLKGALAITALLSKLRQLDEDYRKLNEQLSAVRTARRQGGECSHCARTQFQRDWYIAPTIEKERPTTT